MMQKSSFGTLATGIVRFTIWIPAGADALPDWGAPRDIVTSDPIPGSDPPIVERELVAIGDSTVTWEIGLASREELRALMAKRWTSDTLTVPANVQSHIGVFEERPDGPVERLPHTILSDVANVKTSPDGTVDATVTFLRLIDPSTGEAVP